MNINLTQSVSQSRPSQELNREAISLALQGEWERAAQLNQLILDSSADVDAMNRLGKALMELARYGEAREVLDKVVSNAPYNIIAKKNLARLTQLENTPLTSRQVRKAGSAPQLFIEESGKSGTTLLQKVSTGQVVARIAPSESADLVVENNTIKVYTRDNEYLGQVEPKLGRRLIRLMQGGNRYDAAIIGVNNQGISIIIRETYRHRSLHNVCSFPTRTKEEHRVYLSQSMAEYMADDDLEDDDDDEAVIEEDELDTGWSENE